MYSAWILSDILFVPYLAMSIAHLTGTDAEGYETLTMSLKNANQLVFSLQACKDGQIALSKLPGIHAHFTYELVIGSAENSRTVLRRSVGGTDIASVNSVNILDCYSPRLFWIAWNSNGEISFGSGSVPQQVRLLYYKDPEPYEINSLSVFTPRLVQGIWLFSRFSGL